MFVAPRTALVTGATSGIGFETARLLAAYNLKVILHARTGEEGEAAREHLVKTGTDPLNLELAVADFTRLSQVRDLAAQVAGLHPRLDLLINNAAVGGLELRTLTEDGHETTFQVNYLAPYLLTRLLWDPLTASPESRVINVSSSLHRQAVLRWSDLTFSLRYAPLPVYAQSKLALTMFTKSLAEYGQSGPTVIAVHPGIIETPLMRLYGHTGSPVTEGAVSLVHLASSGAALDNGGYYNRLSPGRSLTFERRSLGRLWKLSARLTDFP